MIARIAQLVGALHALCMPSFVTLPAIAADVIPIIDVHNQYDGTFSFNELMRYLDKGGIGRVIIAPHLHANDAALL